ncbi:hypothetical protein [Actinomadura litoris]|uniref:Xylose isomerase-like TIM barrel n=1 Tax=Actinomadura litoris TaxID=2678616 RepID=A0A7K1L937_9ACTN|nr:hypothetical protein [Actinomadura litoris]MUN40939.1 hypothetical protein [Actinomadura litoris]
MVRLGLSSGSVPGLAAGELAALVRAAGGTVADLRAGKGHRWEEQGIAGLDGLAVSFVGISAVLGADGQDLSAAERYPDRRVKVFAAPGSADAPATAEQMAALTKRRAPERVLVETHRGGASPEELVALCRRHGCRLVLDNLGLDDIADDFASAVPPLAPWTAAVQVKGYDRPEGGGRPPHRPLRATDLGWLGAVAAPGTDITVESRSGTPHEDLTTLRTVWEAIACA